MFKYLYSKKESIYSLNNDNQTNNYQSNTLNSQQNAGVVRKQSRSKYENLKDYEEEVLEKIQKEDLFGDKYYGKEDIFGDFVDKVIERSLYIYRNRYLLFLIIL